MVSAFFIIYHHIFQGLNECVKPRYGVYMHRHMTGIPSQIITGTPMNLHWDTCSKKPANMRTSARNNEDRKGKKGRRKRKLCRCSKKKKEMLTGTLAPRKAGSREENRKDVGEYTQEKNRKRKEVRKARQTEEATLGGQSVGVKGKSARAVRTFVRKQEKW